MLGRVSPRRQANATSGSSTVIRVSMACVAPDSQTMVETCQYNILHCATRQQENVGALGSKAENKI
jgi:hypothetical protein